MSKRAAGADLHCGVARAEKLRAYVHGDWQEGGTGRACCAHCDEFMPPSHFPECARSRRLTGNASDADLVRRGLALVRGESVPVSVILDARDPARAAREWRERWRRRYYRPEDAATIWGRGRE